MCRERRHGEAGLFGGEWCSLGRSNLSGGQVAWLGFWLLRPSSVLWEGHCRGPGRAWSLFHVSVPSPPGLSHVWGSLRPDHRVVGLQGGMETLEEPAPLLWGLFVL